MLKNRRKPRLPPEPTDEMVSAAIEVAYHLLEDTLAYASRGFAEKLVREIYSAMSRAIE